MNTPVEKRERCPIENNHGVKYITLNAARRWAERSGSKLRLSGLIYKLDTMLAESKEGFMNPQTRVAYMLRHDCQPATLRLHGQWVFVIEGDTLVTIHENERGHVKKSPK